MKILDLFCGAGGAAMGYHRAFPDAEIIGVDINPQPNYPFEFVQGDATTFPTAGYDLIHASPPCQGFTAYKRNRGHVKPRLNLIPVTRNRLRASEATYIIENVPGAPLEDPVQLCGSSFGLDIRRHRLFESNASLSAPDCDHSWQTPRFPPASNRINLRSTVEIGVWRIPMDTQCAAMGIDWMSREELSQAIPPSYTHHLAEQLVPAWV